MPDRPVVSSPTFCGRCGHAVEYHVVGGCDVEVRDYGDMDCGCTAYTHAAPLVSAPTDETARETDAEFLSRLERIGRDYRYSDEFIGLVVRSRFPRVWPGARREGRDAVRPSVGAGT